MVILFQVGSNFWIEELVVPSITHTSAEEQVGGTLVNLERPGDCLFTAVRTQDGSTVDLVANLGTQVIRNQANAVFVYGAFLTGFILQSSKAASTAGGTVDFRILAFMRKRRG